MPTEKIITLYTYAELSEGAKEEARSWWHSYQYTYDFEPTVEDFATIAGFMGFDINQRSYKTIGGATRYEPAVCYSIGYCQSDYAGFDATYKHVNGGLKALKAYAPKDKTLHAIAESLQAMQKRNFWKISATICHDERRGFSIDSILKDGDYMYGSDAESDAEEVIREAAKDLAHWLYEQLRNEDEYQRSDEVVAELLEANEYTFTATGKRMD